MITADHGNAEQMLDGRGRPCTTHTTNPVPLILSPAVARLDPRGSLADVAPTILGLLGNPVPDAMTGRSLLAVADHAERPSGRDNTDRPSVVIPDGRCGRPGWA